MFIFPVMILFQKVQSHKYQTREQFLDDVELLYHNSRRYNGPDSALTATALKMLELGRSLLFEVINNKC